MSKVFEAVDAIKNELYELSANIHANPELAFEEYKSCAFIIDAVKKHGFAVKEKAGGLDTAFKAVYKSAKPGATLAFLAEYDCLPGIGHACGHNLIAAASTGAAIALSRFADELGGSIVLLGTPAEEGGGGKVLLIESGEFDGIEYSLMTHPAGVNMVGRGGLATCSITVSARGLAAHSAAPENGKNALLAIIQVFNLIDAVRAQMPNRSNINGIITAGGTAPNIIPDYAQAKFTVRNATVKDLRIVVNMIKNVVKSAEMLTGCTCDIQTGVVYAERYSNRVMDEVFKSHMESLGRAVQWPDPEAKVGSSDIGNVTLIMPAIHEYFKITDSGIPAHNADFANEAIKVPAQEGMIDAAKCLAATGFDIMSSPELREKIQSAFASTVPKNVSAKI